MQEQNEFFVELSKEQNNDSVLLLKSLMDFARKINLMNEDDLVAFYQALRMLKRNQRRFWFKKNPVTENIKSTQLIVIQTMITMVMKCPPGILSEQMKNRFNGAIRNDFINGYARHITSN